MNEQRRQARRRRTWQRRYLNDFRLRLQDAPPGCVIERPGSLAVLIHPTADNTELLRKIEWPSEECTKVDAYWVYKGSIYFVEVWGASWTKRRAGVYQVFDPLDGLHTFQVALTHDLVETRDVDFVFGCLENVVDAGVIESHRCEATNRAVWVSELPEGADRGIGNKGT